MDSRYGKRFLKSKEALTAEQWHHIAMRFRQSYGLSFNGQSYLDCGNNEMLDMGEDLTIEAFIQINSLSSIEGIIGKGYLDAYRFKTFYLDSTERNFEDLFGKVVDPIWLAQSKHPNAAALREANQSDKKPPCWRVFHRVTFISRILPDFPDNTAPTLESVLKAENIDSNWELIQKLDPFVRDQTNDPATFSDAVRQALRTYLPELMPHSAEIITYLALYYGIEI